MRLLEQPMEHCASALEPLFPCLCGWMSCCDSRVVWRADDDNDTPDAIALTIDDVPRKGMRVSDVLELMLLLRQRRARVTFFVFFDRLNPKPDDPPEVHLMVNTFIDHVKIDGHEIGLHFPGRWGNQMSAIELKWRVEKSLQIAQRRYNLPIRHVRMPGGFSTPAQVSLLEAYDLTTVNGTAYPGDADVCQCLSAAALGRFAARLATRDGRIAILHDDNRLIAKLASFLRHLQAQGRHSVTLSELLGPKRVSAETVMDREAETRTGSLSPIFLPF